LAHKKGKAETFPFQSSAFFTPAIDLTIKVDLSVVDVWFSSLARLDKKLSKLNFCHGLVLPQESATRIDASESATIRAVDWDAL
jgi:hypothetical protein